MVYSVSLTEMIEEFHLETCAGMDEVGSKEITISQINRPALQLAGFYDYFDPKRTQIIGMVEHSYLLKMDEAARRETIRGLFATRVPCVILSRDLEVFPEMMEYSEEYGVPVLRTGLPTTELVGELIRWLRVKLAPRLTMHGVLVDIYGEGILITGESGIGKSETALELIKRGHRLVADDAVEVKRVSQETLIGSCPASIRHFIELRGVGIINVRQMFGVQSVKQTMSIDLAIRLEIWDQNKIYDRLGLTDEYVEILGNNITCHTIPVRPGRNIAVICESAAINNRQKKMGYNAAMALNESISKREYL